MAAAAATPEPCLRDQRHVVGSSVVTKAGLHNLYHTRKWSADNRLTEMFKLDEMGL